MTSALPASTQQAPAEQPAPSGTALLTTDNLRKNYGGVKALQGASFEVNVGEVHALLGENGTGKSTMMRILAGVERADSGTVALADKTRDFRSAAEAREAGISIVFQELSLFPDLDVLANLFMGREPRRLGRVDRRAMRRRAEPIVAKLGLTFPLTAKVGSLSLAERQLVEISKALLSKAALLILDEPNSALNATESARLFRLIRELKADGTALIYISHRLEEVFALADRISVMRGGRVVLTDTCSNLTIASVVEAMLGRKEGQTVARVEQRRSSDHTATLRLRNVSVGDKLREVSLDCGHGEVVGLVGLEGAGQQDVLRTVFGDLRPDTGSMTLEDKAWAPANPRAAARGGVAFVPADRTQAGLMMGRSIGDNIAQVRMAVNAKPFFRQHDLHERAQRRVSELRIKTNSTHLPANSLSGGNQQKIVLAKWLEVNPRVLLLDDPTRGVDVGGKAEIYELIIGLARSGVTVLFNSTEFIEYQAVCDRIVVFQSGRVKQEIDPATATEHVLAQAVNTTEVHRRPHILTSSNTSAFVHATEHPGVKL